LDELPKFTQPYSAGHFVIDTITDDGVDDLLRVLTGQPKFARPPRGPGPAPARFPAGPPELRPPAPRPGPRPGAIPGRRPRPACTRQREMEDRRAHRHTVAGRDPDG